MSCIVSDPIILLKIDDITSGDEAIWMMTHGTVGEFVDQEEDWTSYCKRMDQYFIANDIADTSKQRATFLSSCGKPTYSLLRSLMFSLNPLEKT